MTRKDDLRLSLLAKLAAEGIDISDPIIIAMVIEAIDEMEVRDVYRFADS